MPHFKINSQAIAGFAAESKKVGETSVKVLTNAHFTSDDPQFYKLANESAKIFLNPLNILHDAISKYLVVLHKDRTADVYVNDFNEMIQVKVNRPIKKGEPVSKKDIDEISSIKFPDIPIQKTDAILFCRKTDWKFILYFDFTRELDIEKTGQKIGALLNNANYEKSPEFTLLGADKHPVMSKSQIEVLTEGDSDVRYIQTAHKVLFDAECNFKIMSVNGVNGSGAAQLMTDFEHKYHQGHNSSIQLFVFDCDAKKEFEKCNKMRTKNLIPFCWAKNSANKKVQYGIENLFSEKLFKGADRKWKSALFPIITQGKRKKQVSQMNNNGKKIFCGFICNRKKQAKKDFQNFQPLFDLIRQHQS